MKKLLALLMVFGLFVASCNNNKSGKNQKSVDRFNNNRDKDDYGKNDNRNNDDENKTNDNTGNTGWSEMDKNKFLKGCVASFDENQGTLANQICPCVLGKMEKEYSSFTEAETKGGEAASNRIAMQCKNEITGNNGNNNNSMASGWSSNDINEFVTTCVSGAIKEGMSQELSQKYCSCMQQKLEQMYPDPKDAGNITEEQMNTPSMLAMVKGCLTGN